MTNFDEEDAGFLRDIVKSARQRVYHVSWVDRDGVKRLSALTKSEMDQVNKLSGKYHISAVEVLKQAAYIPAAKPSPVVKVETKES